MSTQFARAVLDAAPDAMVVVDTQGIVRYANKQVAALFGFEHDEIIGFAVERLIPERFWGRHETHRKGYVEGMRARPMGQGLALFARRQDGSEFPVEVSLSPIRDEGTSMVAAAIRDVTGRKKAEAELVVAREAAEAAREVADRANQAKSRFLATASHDLRQPLQVLALLNGTLRRVVAPNVDAIEAVEQQELAIGAMSRLLNALLDIGKLESGAIKPDPIDFAVAEIFRELRQEFAQIALNKGLSLEIEDSADIAHSDPSLVEQILRNLLSNAIKYTRSGRVRVRSSRINSGIRIDVIDTGIGIPAEQIPYIYDEFYQVGVATNTTRDGYGLGLSIVLRIVALLRADLDVKSEVNKGSTFSLVLPSSLRATAAPAAAPAASPAREVRRADARLLLVEDDPAVQMATKMLLKAGGYRVMSASTRADALQIAQTQPVDLLITDYHLGAGETGTQVIAELRQILGPSLKAILVTGDTSSAVRELGSDPHLRVASKPIQAEQLLVLIATVLAG
ncbi:MAG TPA: PAS domain S-box protein [Steroidobacteraceae bacterium]|nr:PAS domain S-box protein [Steroidobacteraceae bacterium]